MVKRITATKELLYLSVVGFQFMSGIRYIMGLFESDEIVRKLWESISGTFGQMHAVFSNVGAGADMASGPPEALLLILGFIGFGYVLFTAVPGTATKMSRRESPLVDD